MKKVSIRMSLLLTFVFWASASNALADGQFVDIAPKNQAEVELVLNTLEASINTDLTDVPPIVMMLHGDEAHRFLRSNYNDNKNLVDQAAKLAAYNVINVQICATWMEANNYTTADLFPFISTVPYGAGELDRLAKEENYSEYSVHL
jgi:intracellular sulfur oxidation DsrE/DsrF family protein